MLNLDTPSGMTTGDRVHSTADRYANLVAQVKNTGRTPATPELLAVLKHAGRSLDDFRRDCGGALATAASNRLG